MDQITESGPRRIGEILVAQNVLDASQVAHILEQQRRLGRPFGDLAERLYNVGPEQVEKAWVEQYVCYGTEINLDEQQIDDDALRVLSCRQAWQFRTLPLSREDGELKAATCRDRLQRAVNFAWRRFDEPVYFVIADRVQLEQHLMQHFPWPGVLELPVAG